MKLRLSIILPVVVFFFQCIDRNKEINALKRPVTVVAVCGSSIVLRGADLRAITLYECVTASTLANTYKAGDTLK